MLSRWHYDADSKRDLRIDWLRGLAMACVIIDHSRIKSLLAWFSYQRFWTVTAAEVFVVLSGVVLGMVYGGKLLRSGWRGVVSGLGRRALTLYLAFVGVTLAVLGLSLAGIDVGPITGWDDGTSTPDPSQCFFDPPTVTPMILARVALMRCGPWPFTIVGLYVWLVVAAIPALLVLHKVGWRRLLAVSWTLYVVYRIAPRSITMGAFEGTFPILAWQLLFVHGLTIGYHRDRLSAFVAGCPRAVSVAAFAASGAFAVLAMCNPWTYGPSALHWNIVPAARFEDLYYRYFVLPELGVGRLLNLAVALPVGYAVVSRCWGMLRPFGAIFVTLGQQSLGAFVLHVFGLLVLAHILPDGNAFWMGTLLQITLIVGIAALLNAARRLRPSRAAFAPAEPLGHLAH
jgi:hypothetical protein